MIVVDTQMPMHMTVKGEDSELAELVRLRDPEEGIAVLVSGFQGRDGGWRRRCGHH